MQLLSSLFGPFRHCACYASALLLFVACGAGTEQPGADAAGSGGSQPLAGMAGAGGTPPAAGAGGTPPGAGGGAGSAGAGGLGGGTAGALGGGTAGALGGTAGAIGGASAAGSGSPGGSGGNGGAIGGGGGAAGTAGAGGALGAGAGGSSGAGGTAGAASGQGGAPGGAGGTSGTAGEGSGGAMGYAPCPTSGACKIMPFGDSITEGFPVSGGYRPELFRRARAEEREITFVGSASNGPDTVDGAPFPKNHEGHGGWTIEDEPSRGTDGIAKLVDSSIGSFAPHIVTLMIGTNDINGNIDVAGAPERLGALLDSLHEADPEVLVLVAQIVPTRTDGTNQAVRTYNDAIPALVSERVSRGHHLVLVDMYGAFTAQSDYKTALLGDNLHPNQAGYNRMGEVWYEALRPYLP